MLQDRQQECEAQEGRGRVKDRSDPHYEGTDSSAGGRPRSVTPEEEAQLRDFMAAELGLVV